MSKRPDPKSDQKATPAAARKDRLKAALKSNIARRKAQARARDEAPRGESEQ